MTTEAVLNCRFCRKSQGEVIALLAFPEGLNICDECVSLMVEIIATDHPEWRDMLIEKLGTRSKKESDN